MLLTISESSITLIPTPDKDITRKLQTIISYKYRYKNSQQNTSKLNSSMYKRIIQHKQVGYILGMQSWITIQKLIQHTL